MIAQRRDPGATQRRSDRSDSTIMPITTPAASGYASRSRSPCPSGPTSDGPSRVGPDRGTASRGSPDQSQDSSLIAPTSSRHRRHRSLHPHRKVLLSSKPHSEIPQPLSPVSSSASASTTAVSTGWTSWVVPTASSNPRDDSDRPSLLAVLRSSSFSRRASPYKAPRPVNSSRTQSLSSLILIPSSPAPVDNSKAQPSADTVRLLTSANAAQPPCNRSSPCPSSASPPPSSLCPDEPIDPSQHSETHPSTFPRRVRLRSFRNLATGLLNPLVSSEPLCGPPQASDVSASVESTPVTPSSQHVRPKMVGVAREAALGIALREGSDPIETMEEYAWRSLIARVRVRDYCEGATFAVCASCVQQVRTIVTHSPTRVLFPYDFTADSPWSAHTPPLLSSAALNTITRKQVVDVLIRLVRDRAPVEAQVLEILLEYIGKKWHATDGDVEIIAKKLTEIVSDLECCEPNKYSAVMPTIQRLRFQLGLVSASQLTARLNSLPVTSSNSLDINVHDLIKVWAVRRLNASQPPQVIAIELHKLGESLAHSFHRDAVRGVMRSFGLEGRQLSGKESPARTRTRITSRTFYSASRVSPTKRRTMPFPLWLPRSSTRSNGCEERRPSLPTLLSHAEPANISWPIPLQGQNGSRRSSRDDSPRHTPTPPGPSGEPFNLIGLLDPADVRVAVVDQILELRYRLACDADGWFLGTGQDKAADIINRFPDSDDSRNILVDLRRLFQLPQLGTSSRSGRRLPPALSRSNFLRESKSETKATPPSDDVIPVVHERDVSFDLDQYVADISSDDGHDAHPTDESEDRETDMCGSMTPKVTVSVPLEPAYRGRSSASSKPEDLSTRQQSPVPALPCLHPDEPRASVASEVSRFSFSSVSSAVSSGDHRRSTVSNFVICEAIRVTVDQYTSQEQALPSASNEAPNSKTHSRHSKSLSMLPDSDLYTRVPEMRLRKSLHRHAKTPSSHSAPPCKTDFDFQPPDGVVPEVPRLPVLLSPTPKTIPARVDFSSSSTSAAPLISPILTARPPPEFISKTPPPPSEYSPPARVTSFQRISSSPIDRGASRTPTVSSPEGRSRRHRQMVIVDGEPITPGSNRTPLGMMLSLFSQNEELTPTGVEHILSHAVRLEEERVMAQKEEFDAAARVRLAWLLEQVANELSKPELIAAVQRVLTRLSNNEIPARRLSSSVSYSPLSESTRSSFSSPSVEGGSVASSDRFASGFSPTSSPQRPRPHPPPPSSFGSRTYGRRDLTIKVPPRDRSSIQVTSSPPGTPSLVARAAYLVTSPDMTWNSSEASYGNVSLPSTPMGNGSTTSSDESFSTSPVSLRRVPVSKPPMVRFPTYDRSMVMSQKLQRHRATSEAGQPTVPQNKQRPSMIGMSTSPLAPVTPERTGFPFHPTRSTRASRHSGLTPQLPTLSPPMPVADVHAL